MFIYRTWTGYQDRRQTFELMTRYPDVETMAGIHYPKTGEKDEEEGFQWFMGNKKNYKYIDRERRIDISRSDHHQDTEFRRGF